LNKILSLNQINWLPAVGLVGSLWKRLEFSREKAFFLLILGDT